MCGNFGLLLLRPDGNGIESKRTADADSKDLDGQAVGNRWTLNSLPSFRNKVANDELDNSYHEVTKLDGIRRTETVSPSDVIISPLTILEAQTACTEIRGGQAGGYSTIEYSYKRASNTWHGAGDSGPYRTEMKPTTIDVPYCARVRMVAKKRHPLAADLAAMYNNYRIMSPMSEKGPLSGSIHFLLPFHNYQLMPHSLILNLI